MFTVLMPYLLCRDTLDSSFSLTPNQQDGTLPILQMDRHLKSMVYDKWPCHEIDKARQSPELPTPSARCLQGILRSHLAAMESLQTKGFWWPFLSCLIYLISYSILARDIQNFQEKRKRFPSFSVQDLFLLCNSIVNSHFWKLAQIPKCLQETIMTWVVV
jgi:hypothetical protein